MRSIFGKISLILGIIGILFTIPFLLGIFFGPLAIILGAIGLSRDDKISFSKSGMILGIIILFPTIWVIYLFLYWAGQRFSVGPYSWFLEFITG